MLSLVESEKLSCDICDKEFSSIQSKVRHIEKCKNIYDFELEHYILNGLCVVCEHKFNESDNKYNMVKHCSKHNMPVDAVLKLKSVRENQSRPTIIECKTEYNNCTVENNITNNNIVIFGNEDFSYIQKESLLEVLQTKDAIPKLCQLMRNNPKHPENRNVKVTDMSRKKVKIYTEDGWRPANSVDTFNDMIMESSEILDANTESGSGEYEYYHDKIDTITDNVHKMDMARDRGEDTMWAKESRNDIMLQFVE